MKLPLSLKERYAYHLDLYTRIGLTPLSFEQFVEAMKPRPYKAAQEHDIETEQREGWTYDR
jgi:hypothetical protein